MSVVDDIINKLKGVKFETWSQSEIDALAVAIAALKSAAGGSVDPVLKLFLLRELNKHAKDDIAREMFDNYLYENGKTYNLSLQQMKQMNSGSKLSKSKKIDIRKKSISEGISPEFIKARTEAMKSPGKSIPYKVAISPWV